MEIGRSGLTKISQMICGDEPYIYFPYRSSSSLTSFFVELDMDYVHDGSTRKNWVYDVLVQLNQMAQPYESLPSPQLTKVIESLLNPDYFSATRNYNQKIDFEKSFDTLNNCLKNQSLCLKKQSNGHVKLSALH
jgi:hypothetical protein